MDGGGVEECYDLVVLLQVAIAEVLGQAEKQFAADGLVSVHVPNILHFRLHYNFTLGNRINTGRGGQRSRQQSENLRGTWAPGVVEKWMATRSRPSTDWPIVYKTEICNSNCLFIMEFLFPLYGKGTQSALRLLG